MALRLDLRPDPGDPAVRVDQERRPGGAPVRLAVVLLLDPRAVGLGDRVRLVGEERERQVELLAEGALGAAPCGLMPHTSAPRSWIVVVAVAELAGLDRAAGRVVLRVEVEDRPAAALVGQAVDGPGLVGQGDLGGDVADGWHGSWSERSRGFHDEQAGRAGRMTAASARSGRSTGRGPRPAAAARRPAGSARPRVVDALDAGPDGSSETMSPMRPASGADDRAAVRRRGARPERDPRPRRRAGRASGRPAPASPAGRCWRGRGRSAGRRAPPTMTIAGRARAGAPPRTASSVSDSSLSRPAPLERDAGRLERGELGLAASESPSPTQRSIATPSGPASRAPPSAATTRPTSASQPGQAASSSSRVGRVAVGQDEGVHDRRCYPAPSDRRGPMLDSGPCPTPRSIPRSSASSTPPPARA